MSRLLLASVLLLAACGGRPRVGLEVVGGEDRSSAPGYTRPSPDARLLAIQVSILNNTSAAVPIVFGAFTIQGRTSEVRNADPLTATFADGCAGELSPDRRMATCFVAFDLPAGFEPVEIRFDYEGGRVEAPVSLTTPPAPDGGGVDAGPPAPTRELDLLFMIDNSNSMSEEHASLTAELPSLVNILVSGDFDQNGDTIGPDDFLGFDLRVGVITSDMGTGGFTVPTCSRSDFGDDGILRTQGRTDIAGCMATYPNFLQFAGSPDDFARDVACVAATGTEGCGFEQPLEAMLKALSPSAPTDWTRADYAPPAFFRNTFGHGDTNNNGFVRTNSVLAIVPLTDEEDCSARDAELFNPSSPTYGATDLNLRCFAHADAALHPISRFVDGFLQLRRSASRLVYAPIAGVPVDLVPRPGARPDWDALASEDPARRDDRLEERVDPAMPSRLVPSCNVPGRGAAFPPIRILRVGERLEASGAHVAVTSICQESFRGALLEVVRQARDAGGGT